MGETVQLAYVDQSRDDLDAENGLGGDHRGPRRAQAVGKRELPSRAYVSAFNFKGTDQQKKVGTSPAASATACTSPSC